MTESDKELRKEMFETIGRIRFQAIDDIHSLQLRGTWFVIRVVAFARCYNFELFGEGESFHVYRDPNDTSEADWNLCKEWYEIAKPELLAIIESQRLEVQLEDQSRIRRILKLAETVPVENLTVRYAYNLWKEQQDALQK